MKFWSAATLSFLLLAPAFAHAETAAERKAKAELAAHRAAAAAARERQARDSAQATALAEQQAQSAQQLRKLEDQTAAATQHLATLQAEQTATAARLLTAEAALEKLLPVMQRLAAAPAGTMLATPEPPADAVRGIAIMHGLAVTIESESHAVKTESARLGGLIAAGEAAKTQLTAAVAAQQAAEAQLSRQIDAAKSAELADSDTAVREAAASLAAQKKLASIQAAIARLVPKASHPAPLKPGAGGAPVAGRILRAYGTQTLAGPAQGVSYGAAPGARVASPCAGTVMFAGTFPAYGHMIIANCGGGHSLVLAGMNALDVATGQRLVHGQPVGTMQGFDPSDPTHQPVLYVELRQNGKPVDPTAWLAGGGSG